MDAAARAADRAVVALLGPRRAAAFLNFPLDPPRGLEDKRRYGHDLSTFLSDGLEKEAAAAKDAARRAASGAANDAARARRLEAHERRRDREQALEGLKARNPGLPFDAVSVPCGVCPSCRRPWLGDACQRVLLSQRSKFSFAKALDAEVDAPKAKARRAARVKAKLFAGEDVLAESSDAEGAGVAPARAQRVVASHHQQHKQQQQQKVEWIDDPPRPLERAAAKARRRQLDAEIRLAEQQVAAEDAAAAAAALPPFHVWTALPPAQEPCDIVVPPPHAALLDQAEECAAADAVMALVSDDDPRWVGPPSYASGNQCALCKRIHSLKACPVLRVALAAPAAPLSPCPACNTGDDDEPLGCEVCRHGMPRELWVPAWVPARWLRRALPETLGVMEAARDVANAAVADFCRPDVVQTLGPEALLAVGLLAEEAAASALRAQHSTAKGGTGRRTDRSLEKNTEQV
jgi:hypothetical protein